MISCACRFKFSICVNIAQSGGSGAVDSAIRLGTAHISNGIGVESGVVEGIGPDLSLRADSAQTGLNRTYP